VSKPSGLEAFGWSETFARAFAEGEHAGLVPGRVADSRKGLLTLWTAAGSFRATLSGRLRHVARPGELPTVGDWVAARLQAGEQRAVIQRVLPRKSRFVRRAAGDPPREQVVAANVDTVLLVCGLDGEFEPRRLERLLALGWQSGARPVVVLNKTDCHRDPAAALRQAEAAAPGVAVRALSAREGEGLSELVALLPPAHTAALLGSSGVGKSTLINRLLGEERLRTGAVREKDARGRHTTSHRELVVLPSGGLLIDTPGLREVQLWQTQDGFAEAFEDVLALAQGCRFGDCRHQDEPDCAVREALERGTLDAGRLASFGKLRNELAALAAAARTGARQRR
jgi:ribosome biogenesis GTPase